MTSALDEFLAVEYARPAALSCGFAGCGTALAPLGSRQWTDEANNVASALPEWHQHSPHTEYLPGSSMAVPAAILSPCERQECERRATMAGLPPFNVSGDPLTVCRLHPDRAIYAVAALGEQRDLCAECREARNQGPTSVADMVGRRADAQVTRQQIGGGVLMSCGARDFVKDDANGLLMFRVGPNGRRVCKVLVRLMEDDTYAVEYGLTDLRPSRLSDPTWGEWQTVEQETGIYAEDLARVVRKLGDRETY